jgi:ribosomal protein L32
MVAFMSIRMRHTRSHTKNRRSHHALKGRSILKDEQGNLRLPHRLDESTGMYRGKQILPKKEVKEAKKDHEKRVEAHKEDRSEGAQQPVHTEAKEAKKTGLLVRGSKGGRAKARSGMGGTA